MNQKTNPNFWGITKKLHFDYPDLAEINGYIPKELKRKFKTACAVGDRSISDVLIDLMKGWIDEQDEQNRSSGSKGEAGRDNRLMRVNN